MTDVPDNSTQLNREWRLGGPMSPDQRKEAKRLFIEYMETDPTIVLACDHANIARDTAYAWREKDKAFGNAWENAVKRSQDIARKSIYQPGILGWDGRMLSQGQPVYEIEEVLGEDGTPMLDSRGRPITKRGAPLTERKYSDSLASLYAKANLPEYKDKPQINLNAQLDDLAQQAKDQLL